jgi:hypothetical protein
MRKLILAVLAMVCWAEVSYACFCVKPQVSVAFNQAKAVFVGEVLEIIPPRNDTKAGEFFKDAHTIRFKVERTWKQTFWTEVTVLANRNSCFGFKEEPRIGGRYLVYADPAYPNDASRNEVIITACSRTASISTMSLDGSFFFPDSPADDIRQLDTFIIFTPRQTTPNVKWMTFLDP